MKFQINANGNTYEVTAKSPEDARLKATTSVVGNPAYQTYNVNHKTNNIKRGVFSHGSIMERWGE